MEVTQVHKTKVAARDSPALFLKNYLCLVVKVAPSSFEAKAGISNHPK